TNTGIFIRNLTSNTLIHIPNTSGTSIAPSISGDGKYVTYTEKGTGGARNIILYNVQTNVSITIGAVSNVSSYSRISRDGSTVVYINTASSISVYDRVSQQTSAQTFNVYDAAMFNVSADGRYVVFGSDADDLVANDANGTTDVFV